MPLALVLMDELRSAAMAGMTAISAAWMLCIGFSQIRLLAEWNTVVECDCAWNGHAAPISKWSSFSGFATFDSENPSAEALDFAADGSDWETDVWSSAYGWCSLHTADDPLGASVVSTLSSDGVTLNFVDALAQAGGVPDPIGDLPFFP
eukprot:478191-Amphidinium_carterae.1